MCALIRHWLPTPAVRWPTRLATAAYVLLVLVALALLAVQVQRHSLLVTDLAELLPADAQMGVVERNAQAQSEAALNRQMVMLVGAAERENAEAGASALAALWRQSGVFESVTERTQPDMAAASASLLSPACRRHGQSVCHTGTAAADARLAGLKPLHATQNTTKRPFAVGRTQRHVVG